MEKLKKAINLKVNRIILVIKKQNLRRKTQI